MNSILDSIVAAWTGPPLVQPQPGDSLVRPVLLCGERGGDSSVCFVIKPQLLFGFCQFTRKLERIYSVDSGHSSHECTTWWNLLQFGRCLQIFRIYLDIYNRSWICINLCQIQVKTIDMITFHQPLPRALAPACRSSVMGPPKLRPAQCQHNCTLFTVFW